MSLNSDFKKNSFISITLPNLLTKKTSKLLACLSCSIILPNKYFTKYGCPNCDFNDFNISKYTSSKFRNISIIYQIAWVANWQHYNLPGVYALCVIGELPEECISDLINRGMIYRKRSEAISL